MNKNRKAGLRCIVALFLAIVMILGMVLPAFAAEPDIVIEDLDDKSPGTKEKVSVSADKALTSGNSLSDSDADSISIDSADSVSDSDIKIEKDDGIDIKDVKNAKSDGIVMDSYAYKVEWYDGDLNLLKSETRYGELGDVVYATDDDKADFDGFVFDEENGLNKLDCKVNIYDSAVIWVMMKEKPKAGPRKAQSRYLSYPLADDINLTHYFITDLSDYGGHRLVKTNNTYWR